MSSQVSQKSLNVFETVRVDSPLNGDQPLFALLGYEDICTLEGKLLTINDATQSDPTQRKAVKDLIRQTLWWHWVPSLHRDPSQPSGGMPIFDK